ncbi:MAG TPA: bifunctional pyr operon transcriptional regulator/uracil phosphoribosyltransferase PyrR [Spirochaetota bacterium]|nr:bifunctional pyr operon transcriptional regulator/uracil phosphoribosyltransferase PyrR [Spirochaetota bacterium]HNT11045.1 bifunctional pyr operon transcriptional regulator/uracil phosphoribosyltransferase PyrR [Spirochaetota bacterium]HNV48223.1 bifunctional pyr operon transcriptional regulator/uracil phosphoribosyltransferase PyrR [Spirochaetota bacterium]HOS40556.1 bifunctional pyr operon transcriptional regulator/uracil phosphoribosyltransferase PyrR [Spirochaetota bacterium]HPI22401.1 
MSEQIILTGRDIERIIADTAARVCADIGEDADSFGIVGIQTRGVELADRIRALIERDSGKRIKSGTLDITFYRDDLSTRGVLPVIKETRIEFDITDMTILLVDDVIFSGRTTKAALETLMSFGRPRAIRFFVLIDRGNRELPIQPDYCGYKIETGPTDQVRVLLAQTDGTGDSVVLQPNGA